MIRLPFVGRAHVEKQLAALEATNQLLRFAHARLAKAQQPAVNAARAKTFATAQPKFTDALSEYFRAFGDRLIAKVAKDALHNFDPSSIDWDAEALAIGEIITQLYDDMGDAALAAAGLQLGFDVDTSLPALDLTLVKSRIATLVTGINDESRQQIVDLVAQAISSDSNASNLATALRVLTDKWAGIDRASSTSMLGDDTIAGWLKDDIRAALDASSSRANAISLTETANAYNLSSISAYKTSGLVDGVEVFDGPECGWTEHDDPDLADGSIRTLDEANDYPISHPNCQRAFGPVVSVSADDVDDEEAA